MTTWFLIADSSRARLFERTGTNTATLLKSFEHPEGRAHAGDISEDLGRTRQTGSGAYSAEKDERQGMKTSGNLKFAGELAEVLKNGAVQNEFQELVLVASPQFLGLLRKQLHPKAVERIRATLDKDLTEVNERDQFDRQDVDP